MEPYGCDDAMFRGCLIAGDAGDCMENSGNFGREIDVRRGVSRPTIRWVAPYQHEAPGTTNGLVVAPGPCYRTRAPEPYLLTKGSP